MKLIFGLLFGIGCIFGGYVIAGGKMGPILIALPVKMMIIMGGALGAFFINNEPKVLKGALAGIGPVFWVVGLVVGVGSRSAWHLRPRAGAH